MSKMSRWFSLSIVLILLGSLAVYAQEDDYTIVDDCPDLVVTCTCGIGATEQVKQVKQKQFAVKNELGDIECRGPYDPYLICANYTCAATFNKTEKLEGDFGSNLLKRKRNIVQTFYPHEIVLPRGENASLVRSARQADACTIPTLKNAEIKCWKWPNWINCDVTCIHGYALANNQGSTRTTNLNCRLTENQWKPHAFQDCQPYVNCKAHLTKPGDLKCKEPTDGPATARSLAWTTTSTKPPPFRSTNAWTRDLPKLCPTVPYSLMFLLFENQKNEVYSAEKEAFGLKTLKEKGPENF